MFGVKSNVDEIKLSFKASKGIYREKEAIEKNQEFISLAIDRIFLINGENINFQNKNEPINFAEDKDYFYVNILFLIPGDTQDKFVSKLIDDIRYFFIENEELGFRESEVNTPYNQAVLESDSLREKH